MIQEEIIVESRFAVRDRDLRAGPGSDMKLLPRLARDR